jgi:hypothetical protein
VGRATIIFKKLQHPVCPFVVLWRQEKWHEFA